MIKDCVEGFKFGADPELFLVDADGTFLSADGIIPGTKAEPYKVDKGAVQVDGLAAEYNIDPASSFEEWNTNHVTVLRQLKSMLPKGVGFHIAPAIRFSESVMESQSDKAKQLGCDPDYNAYTKEQNPPPNTSEDPLLRTGSGHVHVGWDDDCIQLPSDPIHFEACCDLAKQLDWFLGGWSVKQDPDATRRQLYGRAGAFRPKPYGMEYRVLSNFWIAQKETRLLVWNRMNSAVEAMPVVEYGKVYEQLVPMLTEAINTGVMDKQLYSAVTFPLLRI